jgi:hypothetical protein
MLVDSDTPSESLVAEPFQKSQSCCGQRAAAEMAGHGKLASRRTERFTWSRLPG